MPIGGELLFGQIAIQNGMIKETDLAHALEVQQREAKSGRMVSIGQVLTDIGVLGESQILTILAIQKFVQLREEDKSFGSLAVANAFITEPQLQRCLDQQKLAWKGKRMVERIGEIMIRLGLLSAQQRDAILVSQERLLQANSTVIRPEGVSASRRVVSPHRIEVVLHQNPAPVETPPVARIGDAREVGPARTAGPADETRLGVPSIGAPLLPPDDDKNDSDPLISLRSCVCCQSTTDGERVKCQSCGRRSCIYCGMVAEDEDRICTDCGARLDE